MEHAVDQFEFRPHRFEPINVNVDGAGAEIIAAGKSNSCLAGSRQKGPKNKDLCPHPTHQVDRCLGEQFIGNLDRYGSSVKCALGAYMGEHLAHEFHVEDARDVVDSVGSGSEQRGHQMLEHGVLGSADGYRPLQTRATFDYELIHDPGLYEPRGVSHRRAVASPHASGYCCGSRWI